MTTFLLSALVVFCAGLCGEGYFVLGNQQRTQTMNEQILSSNIDNRRLLEANMRLLAMHPSKSAARTTAPDDAPAYVPYTGLRELDDTDRWADDGGPEPVAVDEPVVEPITEPIPVVQPQTEPTPRVDVVGGARVTGRPVPHKRGRHAA